RPHEIRSGGNSTCTRPARLPRTGRVPVCCAWCASIWGMWFSGFRLSFVAGKCHAGSGFRRPISYPAIARHPQGRAPPLSRHSGDVDALPRLALLLRQGLGNREEPIAPLAACPWRKCPQLRLQRNVRKRLSPHFEVVLGEPDDAGLEGILPSVRRRRVSAYYDWIYL